ncbi:MAG TPA: hypothetical protein PKE29_07935 [Phycisphaerales bacterium]|nr:hypothetical protein [Phycisphaerales bacterium]
MPESAGIAITAASTILPGWVVIPIAGVVLVVTARHVLRVETSGLDPVRRRVRIANGLLMMLVTTLLAYALGLAPEVKDAASHPGEAKAFIAVWVGILGLLGVVVVLAVIDAVGTVRAGMRMRRQLRGETRRMMGATRSGEPPRG